MLSSDGFIIESEENVQKSLALNDPVGGDNPRSYRESNKGAEQPDEFVATINHLLSSENTEGRMEISSYLK